MTISSSPIATLNSQKALIIADSIEARVSNINELIDGVQLLYERQQTRVQERDSPENKLVDLQNGPWKNSAFGGQSTAFRNGVEVGTPIQNSGITLEESNSIWDFIFNEPITTIYYTQFPAINRNNPNYIQGYSQGRRLERIYGEHIERINFNNGLRDSITNAVEQIKNFNSVGYQAQLDIAKTIISKIFINELTVFNKVLEVVALEIRNPQSIIYKPGSPFGPFSPAEIEAFNLNFDDIIAVNNNLISVLNSIYKRIDEIASLSDDILARVSLVSAGLVQNPRDPSEFDLFLPEEKDPWGIRFSYRSPTLTGRTFAEPLQENEFDPAKSGFAKHRDKELEASLDILENNTIITPKDFYFQLLPAIKTNMPSSGSTDVPGAMPGIQFRIENNIVKHKIPGFAPVYQPIGIDSIKCTLVGMFTGNDGLDISRSFSDDITAGLLRNGESGTLNKGGPFQETIYSLYDSSKGAKAIGGGASNLIGGLPEIRGNASSTAATVPVMSEDAFRGAQDFYNEIVSQGREVEVELNLRKGSGPFPGGSGGPFRDPETGNPKFKGLIKRMDMYYVRRDRCWFIIDLEITDSGLIGKECINLTNVIEESLDIFENVKAIQRLDKQQLDDCFKSKVEIRMQSPRDTDVFVVDLATGLSYFYNRISGNLKTDRSYPLSFNETMTFLASQAKGGELFFSDLPSSEDLLGNNTFNIAAAISNLAGGRRIRVITLMTRLAELYPLKLSSEDNDLSTYWLPSTAFSYGTNLNGTAWRLDKSIGKFYYVYDKNGSLVRSPDTSRDRARTLQELISNRLLGFNDSGSVDKFINFYLNDYIPLLDIPDKNDCTDILDDLAEQEVKRAEAQSNAEPGVVIEVPKPTRRIFESDDFELTPVPVVPPRPGRQRARQEVKDFIAVKKSVKNGTFDTLLTQAVSEYFLLIEKERINVTIPTALSPELVLVIQREFKKGNLLVEGRARAFTYVKGSTEHISSSKNLIRIRADFTLQQNIIYKVENRRFRLTPDFIRPFDFSVQAYMNNGVKEYRVSSLKVIGRLLYAPQIQISRTIGEEGLIGNTGRSIIAEAAQNINPSASNPPVVAPE